MNKSKKPKRTVLEMAIAALEPSQNPLDIPMGGFDPAPTALGLDDAEETGICPNSRRIRAADRQCIICGGHQVSEDWVDGDEG